MFTLNPLTVSSWSWAAQIPAKALTDDQLSPLRQFSGQILTTSVVLVVGGLVTAVVLWFTTRATGMTKAQHRGMTIALIAVMAGAGLGSLNALVGYGSTLGQDSLMPPVARQPTVDITKNPAKSTCTDQVEVKFGSPADDDTLRDVLGSKADPYIKNGWMKVQWTPTGPNCASTNHTADPCSSIAITALEASGPVDRPKTTTIDPSASCKK